MNKLSRFTSYGIEDDEVVTKDGDTEVVVTAEPPKDTEEPEVNDDAPTEGTPPIETTNVDLEPKDDSEETDEEKEKKIKIEIEIAQESLNDICKQMEDSLQKGGLGVQGRMIAKASINHIAKQFNLEQTKTTSLEGYGYQIDDFHATRIEIDNIKEVILLLKNK
jgi:hypothetical protein